MINKSIFIDVLQICSSEEMKIVDMVKWKLDHHFAIMWIVKTELK